VSGGSGELEGVSSLWQDEEGPVSLLGQNAGQRAAERSPFNGGGAESSAAAISQRRARGCREARLGRASPVKFFGLDDGARLAQAVRGPVVFRWMTS
jgi:hypothetical protein